MYKSGSRIELYCAVRAGVIENPFARTTPVASQSIPAHDATNLPAMSRPGACRAKIPPLAVHEASPPCRRSPRAKREPARIAPSRPPPVRTLRAHAARYRTLPQSFAARKAAPSVAPAAKRARAAEPRCAERAEVVCYMYNSEYLIYNNVIQM